MSSSHALSNPANNRVFDPSKAGAASSRGRLARLSAAMVLVLTFGPTACSDEKPSDDGDNSAGSAAGGRASSGGAAFGGAARGGAAFGGESSSQGPLGTFLVALNPAVEDALPYTSIFGKVYGAPYPTDVIETVIASDSGCKVYKFSLQGCFEPTCTGNQTCVAQNVCEAKPSVVSVGDVTVDGVGPSRLKLTAVNDNYQYPLDLPYPGVTEGEPVTLTGSGGVFSGFTLSAKGVAPVEVADSSYFVANDQPLTINWTKGASSVGAEITITFNISKHGGSAGYMKCSTTDSGALTVSADLLKELLGLGIAGFPELLITRSTHAVATVSAGTIALEVQALAKPALNIEGYCSCFDASDCGSCSDKTKTSCDSVRKLCKTP